MALNFPNAYHHRKVADSAARACEICFKLCTSVLVTPDKKDFFYVCPEHLKQPAFCKPIVDQAAIDAKKKKELDDEVERVKKEFEERQQRKNKNDSKKSDKKDKDNNEEDDGKKENCKKGSPPAKEIQEEGLKPEVEPRVFELHRTFYQERLARKRQAEMDKRNRERFADPNLFPSVPKGQP